MGHLTAAKTRHDSTDVSVPPQMATPTKAEPQPETQMQSTQGLDADGEAYFLWDENFILGGTFLGDPIYGTVDRCTTALTFVRAQRSGRVSYTGTLEVTDSGEWAWSGKFAADLTEDSTSAEFGEWSATTKDRAFSHPLA